MFNPEGTKFIPAQELTDDESAKVAILEEETDDLYRQKVELAAIRNKVHDILPPVSRTVHDESGNPVELTHPANWRDLAKLQAESGLEKAIEQKLLEQLADDPNKQTKVTRRLRARLADIKRGLAISEQITQREGDLTRTENSSLEQNTLRHYKNFRLRELLSARKDIFDIEQKMAANRQEKEDATGEGDIDDIHHLNAEYQRYQEELKEIVDSSPEAFLCMAGRQTAEAKNVFDEDGTIVETPYVKEKILRILDVVSEGRPVFIHGELGSGKTELAKHLSRQYLSREHVARWEAAHPKPEGMEEQAAWEAQKKAETEILEIRGLRSLEKEDLLARTMIEREEVPEPEEQVDFLNTAWEKYKKSVLLPAAEKIEDPEEKKQFMEKCEDQLKKAYFEKWRAHVKTVEKLSPIFQAMKEGRPVLIDEMNAIPHHVLIVLNDIINRRPGESVFTPSGEEIEIKEGFSVISTGNWRPEDGHLYVGRQPIDAAFLSRLGLVDYDFLPQAKDFNALTATSDIEGTRKLRQNNELFRMLVVRLLDDQLGAKLPEGSLEKVHSLAVAARVIQDVFSQKDVDRAYFFHRQGTDLSPSEVLQENVLSLRHLIPIIEKWKADGFVRDLDDYVYLEYVQRSKARPQEMMYIYQVLKEQAGFFSGRQWPDARSEPGLQAAMNYPAIKEMYGVDEMTGHENAIPKKQLKLKYYTPVETIEALYGPLPERKRYPGQLRKVARQEAATNAERESAERLARLQRFQEDYKEAKAEANTLTADQIFFRDKLIERLGQITNGQKLDDIKLAEFPDNVQEIILTLAEDIIAVTRGEKEPQIVENVIFRESHDPQGKKSYISRDRGRKPIILSVTSEQPELIGPNNVIVISDEGRFSIGYIKK